MKIDTTPLPGHFRVEYQPQEISGTGCPVVEIYSNDEQGQYHVATINAFYAGTDKAIQTARLFAASKAMLIVLEQAIERIYKAQEERFLTKEELETLNAMTLVRRKALYG